MKLFHQESVLQGFSEIFRCDGLCMLRHFLRRTREDDLTSGTASVGAYVDKPVWQVAASL